MSYQIENRRYTGISTAARPTYRMNQKYSHHEATPETIFNLFKESGLI